MTTKKETEKFNDWKINELRKCPYCKTETDFLFDNIDNILNIYCNNCKEVLATRNYANRYGQNININLGVNKNASD